MVVGVSAASGLERQDDGGLPRFRVRLSTVLALMRVLAGPRGRSRVRWWAGGFSYELVVVRQADPGWLVEWDPTGAHVDDARDELRGRLSE